ncbi:RND family efflux transporter MFP subunit [Pseudomonas putida]|nr:RND family efflux transporter MFP subunit [Pseudomonas sp. PvP089]MBP2086849.1 RND family efflux transporter MFP subunit [Pseudomonas sp. PvP088]MBP2220990.1 RND family efflux transporter MFP subunit [Pseudomonas putida]
MRAAVRTLVTLCVVALAVLAGYQLWQYYMLTPWTRDARVRADVVVIAPDVSGWVRELKVHDNQQVKAGDLLMNIDRERFQAAFDQARAVTETRAQQLRLREREAARRTALGPEAISAELRENAQINAAIARGELHEAEAQLQVAKINLARSEVRAPRSGHITNLRLAEGNYVNTGESVMALVDDSTFYIQAYFEETKLPRIRVGDTVKVWLMGAGEPMQGHVESISLRIPR